MDVFVLDSQLKRSEILETYESVIWTERYSAFGDFELHIKSTPSSRAWLAQGSRLATNKSDRVMVVESVEKNTDESGVEMLVVRGRSIEAVLEDRSAVESVAAESTAKYYIAGVPGDIVRTLFHRVCVAGSVTPLDIIPMVASPSFTRDPLEPLESITWHVEPDNLYNAIKKLCDVYDLGFKLIRPTDAPSLQFYIYAGKNRTSSQTVNNPVMFSQVLGNIQNTKSLSSDQLIKNVIYLRSSALNRIIYAPGVDPNVAGFQRRIVTIDLGDKGEPPNAGAYPEPASPFVGTPEPDYGYPYLPVEPYYEPLHYVNPTQAELDAHLLSQQQFRDNWLVEIEVFKYIWQQEKDVKKADWQALVSQEYTVWYNNLQDQRNAWAVENARLRAVWLAEISDDMTQRAAEEFEKHKRINEFDGEINQRSTLRYGVDYDLGDLVELRNEDGVRFTRRVTEQIFVGDKEGEKAYPTLSETVRTT